jgi:hypothetical protein
MELHLPAPRQRRLRSAGELAGSVGIVKPNTFAALRITGLSLFGRY